MDYGKLDLHMAISDVFADSDDILYGFAIRSEDEASFFIDLEALVKRYGGVPFDELLKEDEADESADAAIRLHKGMSRARIKDAIIDVLPLEARTGSGAALARS